MDGNYINIEKKRLNMLNSGDVSTCTKGRPLIKPLVITTTDGYMVSVMDHFLQMATIAMPTL